MQTTAAEYGIELEASYSGSEVLSLLLAAENETETSIKNAYAEGYKAGLLEYAPENARLVSLNESLAKEAASQAALQSAYQAAAPFVLVASFLGGIALRSALCRD